MLRQNYSIFYSITSWHKILNEAIKPFLLKHTSENLISKYFIAFSKDQGDHIKISLYTEDESKAILNEFHSIIGYYIDLKPSMNSIEKSLGDSFFMNFENNQILIELFNFDTQEDDSLDKSFASDRRNILFEISKIITKLSYEDEITDDVLFINALSIHIIIVTCILKFTGEDKSIFLKKYIVSASKNLNISQQVLIDKNSIAILIDNLTQFETWYSTEGIQNLLAKYNSLNMYIERMDLKADTCFEFFNSISEATFKQLTINNLTERTIIINLLYKITLHLQE